MKNLLDAIDDVYNELKEKYNPKEIDNMILYSIIRLFFKDYLSSREIDNISFLKGDNINYKKAYNLLKDSIKNAFDDKMLFISYEYLVGKKELKEKYAIYYTPDWIVKYMVDYLISDNLEKTNEIENLKIMEPSCGGGAFLIYLFDTLYDWYSANSSLDSVEICKKIINNHLYGVDIDKKALEVAKLTLIRKVIKNKGDYNKCNFNLLNIDFLKEDDLREFDIIIGNPPYLENRKINKYFDKTYLKKIYTTAVGRFDIYSLFIEKSINILKSDGIVSFILPGNLLYNNNFTNVRNLILSNSSILELINLGDGIFKDVNMNMAIISFKKGHTGSNLIKCKNISSKGNVKVALNDSHYRYINQDFYNNLLNNVFDIDSSITTFNLRNKVYKKNYLRINDICEVVAGIATGNIKNKLVSFDKNLNSKRLLEGRDINRYSHKWRKLYINYDKDIINRKKGEYATFMRREFIDNEKILIRQTADRFICSYDNEGYLLLNTLYSLILRKEYKNEIDLKYILGLLNSKFYSFLYKSLIREDGKLFPQVKIFHIQNSPLIIPNSNITKEISKRADDIIKLKKAHNTINKDTLKLTIDKLEREIDGLVYEIFKLSKGEITQVESEFIK